MPKIGDGGNRPGGLPGAPQEQGDTQNKITKDAEKSTAVATEAMSQDVMEMLKNKIDPVRGQLANQMQAIATKTVGANAAPNVTQFANEFFLEIAKILAVLVRNNPKASRKERARLFAKAILKKSRGRFKNILDTADEKDLESMFDTIADQLDSSPVFAQMVDEATEGARKMG